MGKAQELMLSREGDSLRWGDLVVPFAEVRGFHERFNTWTGRAHTEVVGPGWKLPIGEGYGPNRSRLRQWFPDAPFKSEWADGRFPAMALGVPSSTLMLVGVVFAAIMSVFVAATIGFAAGGLVVLAALWPLVRFRDAVVVKRGGVRVGPVWAPTIGWHEIKGISVTLGKRRARGWA
ncbi:MAG: hypothetical protein HN348_25190, partial [Proteobacteria bacterium]|nr:hypothetical protein [Pseudomonadota bacterium]